MPRLPRFKLSPAIPPPRLTRRDGGILKCLQRHRFLRSDHIVALSTGSRQRVLRRLQRLFHHGYLEWPRCQIDYDQSGSRRIAYGLGNKGAAWLKHELSLQFHQLDWKQKSRVGRLFLERALLVSDIMVAVELACRNRKGIQLLSAEDLQIANMRETAYRRHKSDWEYVSQRTRLQQWCRRREVQRVQRQRLFPSQNR